MPTPPLSCLGALALELTPQTLASRLALPQAEAAELAALAARDLAKLVPGVTALDFTLLGAHFDPAELLRPSWPVHAAVDELARGAPGRREAGRVIAFGSHAGGLPEPLAPDVHLVGGPLRLLPFVLSGPHEAAVEVGAALEASLLDTGMAGADTALLAQSGFGAQVEHARYLTLHDLCALTAVQYEHAGLAPLWPLLEVALLAPDQDAWLDEAPEPLLRYVDGEVRMAGFDIDTWADAGLAPEGGGAEALPRAYTHFQRRQRQFTAVVRAHGIEVRERPVSPGADPRSAL